MLSKLTELFAEDHIGNNVTVTGQIEATKIMSIF